jgi:dihydropyrimidinase
MSTFDRVIRGGTVVTAADATSGDVGIKDGVVVAVGRGLAGGATTVDADGMLVMPGGATTVDADGMLVMPGGVDSHVHLDQPPVGAQMCDDFDTGTASAAAGAQRFANPIRSGLASALVPIVKGGAPTRARRRRFYAIPMGALRY